MDVPCDVHNVQKSRSGGADPLLLRNDERAALEQHRLHTDYRVDGASVGQGRCASAVASSQPHVGVARERRSISAA